MYNWFLHPSVCKKTFYILGLNVEDAFAILTQAIYDKIESGEYRVDGDWDGIKRGFYLAAGSR
jgi:hypothetical protein